MSKKIGIVSEGVSDFWVLRHIITRYLKDQDLWVLPLNPKQTKDGKQDGPGGWGLVMKYLEDKNKKLIVEPCPNPVNIKTIIRFTYVLTFPFLFPPSGIYT